MSKVLKFEKPDGPYRAGMTECYGCHHKWAAVAPLGPGVLECPECGAMKGIMKYPVERSGDHWVCGCGNYLFQMTPEGIYCPNCGDWQKGF